MLCVCRCRCHVHGACLSWVQVWVPEESPFFDVLFSKFPVDYPHELLGYAGILVIFVSTALSNRLGQVAKKDVWAEAYPRCTFAGLPSFPVTGAVCLGYVEEVWPHVRFPMEMVRLCMELSEQKVTDWVRMYVGICLGLVEYVGGEAHYGVEALYHHGAFPPASLHTRGASVYDIVHLFGIIDQRDWYRPRAVHFTYVKKEVYDNLLARM